MEAPPCPHRWLAAHLPWSHDHLALYRRSPPHPLRGDQRVFEPQALRANPLARSMLAALVPLPRVVLHRPRQSKPTEPRHRTRHQSGLRYEAKHRRRATPLRPLFYPSQSTPTAVLPQYCYPHQHAIRPHDLSPSCDLALPGETVWPYQNLVISPLHG